jgi:AcrR family transcriptional regulator
MDLTGKAATQERILAAAFDLFVSRGYPETTVRQIADAAGVSRATVFWHFGEKAAVFRGVLDRLMTPIRASLELDDKDVSPSKQLEDRVVATHQFVQEHQKEILALVRFAAEDEQLQLHVRSEVVSVANRFSTAIAEAVAQLEPDSRDPLSLGKGVELAFYGGVVLSLLDTSERTVEERHAAVLELVHIVQRLATK